MPEWTCGQRAVRCLCGEPVDRLPYGVGLGWQPWPQTLERWRAESGDPQLDLQRRFGFDNAFVLPELHSGIYPLYEPVTLEERDGFVIWRDERSGSATSRHHPA